MGSRTSGAVRLGDVSGETVDISTGGGNVELALTEAPTAAIRTASGTVGLKLAPEGALVAFTTGSGRLRTTADDASLRTGGRYLRLR